MANSKKTQANEVTKKNRFVISKKMVGNSLTRVELLTLTSTIKSSRQIASDLKV